MSVETITAIHDVLLELDRSMKQTIFPDSKMKESLKECSIGDLTKTMTYSQMLRMLLMSLFHVILLEIRSISCKIRKKL